jgi:hypothetical protein
MFTLENSIPGKAFAFGWDQAMVAISERLKGLDVEIHNKAPSKPFKTYDTFIHNVPFTVRAQNCLLAEGIRTVGDLLKYSERDLYKIPNMGRKSVKDILEVLATMHVKLGDLPLKFEQPSKPPSKKRVNHSQQQHAYRRNKIYQAYKIEKLGATRVAREFGITVARVYQIVQRVELERQAQAARWPNPIRSAKSAAGRLAPPPWLLEKEVQSEPSDDQSSGTASSGV